MLISVVMIYMTEVDFMANRAGQTIRALVGLGIFLLFLGVKLDANAAPVTMPDGGTFDAEYYAQNNPDVVAILGTDANVLYQHYLTSGRLEGRKPYADNAQAGTVAATGAYVTLADGTLFDPVYYAAANPDIAAVLGTDAATLAQHYVTSGKLEGRKPNGTTVNQSTATVPTSQKNSNTVSNPSSYVPAQQSNASTSTVSAPVSQRTNSGNQTVYLPATGHCYHSIPDCGRMNPNKATRTTESKAISLGYDRCSKCF